MTAIISQLRDATWWVDRFERCDAASIADHLIDLVVGALRKTPRWRAVPRVRFELALADVRREVEHELYDRLADLARADDVLEAVADTVAEMLIKSKAKANGGGRRQEGAA